MDYNEGKKVGLRKSDIDFITQILQTEGKESTSTLSRFATGVFMDLMLSYPQSKSFLEALLSKEGKNLNPKKVIDFLNYEISNPYFDPDYGINAYRQQIAKDLLQEMSYLKELYAHESNLESSNEDLESNENIKQNNVKTSLSLEINSSINEKIYESENQKKQLIEENTQDKMLALVNEGNIFYKIKRFFVNLFRNRKIAESF